MKRGSTGQRLMALGAVAATAGLLAACGSSSKASTSATTVAPGASSSSSPATSAPSSGPTANLSGKSFSILGVWTGGEAAAFQSVLNGFDKQTGAHGTFTAAAGGNISTVLGTQVAGGTPPDVAILSLPGLVDQYAKGGKLQPANAAVQAAVKSNYAAEWATLGSYNGTLYGVPVDAADKSTVWYNATAFKNAGITTPPTTWTQLIADAKTLSAAGVSVPISIGGGDGWTLTDWFENVYIRTAGLANYDKLTHHEIPWTDPTVTVALDDLNQVWSQPSLIGSRSAALKVPFTGSVDNVFKASPTSAEVYEASFVATTITSDKDPAVVGATAKFFPFPSVNGSAPVVEASGDFAVAFTTNPAAQAFLQYLASPVAARELVSSSGSGFLTPNKAMAITAYPDATSALLAQQIVNVGDNFRFDMSDQAPAAFGGTANQGEWADLQSFLASGNVAATQKQLEADANKVSWS
jgi:ABC-type glycerol-3-phosphate transport system substrate-binding protein